MKISNPVFFLISVLTMQAKATTEDKKIPCMDIAHTDEVISCMFDLSEKKDKEYNKEYKLYLDSIKTNEERPYNKKKIYTLAKEAKENWDLYVKKECLAEALVYEKGSYGFNDTYNSCLINNYTQRIKYYKENKF